jgi:hypothetical protein
MYAKHALVLLICAAMSGIATQATRASTSGSSAHADTVQRSNEAFATNRLERIERRKDHAPVFRIRYAGGTGRA